MVARLTDLLGLAASWLAAPLVIAVACAFPRSPRVERPRPAPEVAPITSTGAGAAADGCAACVAELPAFVMYEAGCVLTHWDRCRVRDVDFDAHARVHPVPERHTCERARR